MMKYCKRITYRKWIMAGATLGLIALGAGVWSRAQNANAKPSARVAPNAQDIEPHMTPERELARLAILEPASFEKLARKVKAPQELQDEEIAKFAISQPQAYSAEFGRFKDNERKQKERDARDAVLDPVKHSGSVEALKEDVRKKKERGEEIDEILDPKFKLGNIPGKPALKQPKPIR